LDLGVGGSTPSQYVNFSVADILSVKKRHFQHKFEPNMLKIPLEEQNLLGNFTVLVGNFEICREDHLVQTLSE
jgi:hypothetical protein